MSNATHMKIEPMEFKHVEACELVLDNGVAVYILDILGTTEAHDNLPHHNSHQHGLTSAQLANDLHWLMPEFPLNTVHYYINPTLHYYIHPTRYYYHIKMYQVSNTDEFSPYQNYIGTKVCLKTKFRFSSLWLTLRLWRHWAAWSRKRSHMWLCSLLS